MSEIMETAGQMKKHTCLKLPTPKFCPITGNQPMSCTRAGWDASCRKFQELERNSYLKATVRAGQLTKYCAICMGDYIPDNVTFIDIPQRVEITCDLRIPKGKKPLTEEKEMAGRRYTAGSCECCGKKRNLTSHCGKTVCSSCINFRISAKNSPELVIAALREFGNFPDEKDTFQPELNDYVTLTQYNQRRDGLNAEIDELKKKLENFEKGNDTPWHATVRKILKGDENEDLCLLAKRRMQVMEKLEYSYNDASTALVEAEAQVEDQSKEIEELNIVMEELKKSIREQQKEHESKPFPQLASVIPLQPDADVVEKFAWKLADGLIAGTITGIGIEDIRMLRSLM